jgi:hypothetical protein
MPASAIHRLSLRFVGGSIAAHTDDEVSDVDLYAVTLEPDYSQFFTRRQAFMHT